MPYNEFSLLVWNDLLLQRSYGRSLGAKSYSIISDEILISTLNITVTRAFIFYDGQKLTYLFLTGLENEDVLSPYVTLISLSCKESIALPKPLLWNTQTKVSKLRCYKWFRNSFSFFLDTCMRTIISALSFCLVFLQIFFM